MMGRTGNKRGLSLDNHNGRGQPGALPEDSTKKRKQGNELEDLTAATAVGQVAETARRCW